MALNDSCHLLIETKHHFSLYKNLGGLEQNLGGLEPLSPIASAATVQTAPILEQFVSVTPRLCRPSLTVKKFALSIDSLPDRILYVSIRSPRSLLFQCR